MQLARDNLDPGQLKLFRFSCHGLCPFAVRLSNERVLRSAPGETHNAMLTGFCG
jgi:hypothetical protein